LAINLICIIQIVDTDTEYIINQSSKTTTLVAPEDTEQRDTVAIARARLDTVLTEVSSDIQEQLKTVEGASE
jgi:hypothetical protein